MEGVLALMLGCVSGVLIYIAIHFICHLPGKSGMTLSDHFDDVKYNFLTWCEKHLPW